MDAERVFRCSWDRETWVRTIILGILLLGVFGFAIAYSASVLHTHLNAGIALLVAAFVIFILPLVLIIMQAPLRYVVMTSGVVVVRLWRNVIIPADQIVGVEPADFDYVFDGVVGGGTNAGMFGVLGRFFGRNEPDFISYVTRRDKLVLIKMRGDSSYVLSPNESDAFIQDFQRMKSS